MENDGQAGQFQAEETQEQLSRSINPEEIYF